MTAAYYSILTNNGKALIANATVSAPVGFSDIAVGDGNGSVPTPLETRTALVNEKARFACNSVAINTNNTNWIEAEIIIPSTSGGYTIRELGLYAGATLVAIANFPSTYKPLETEGGAREIAIKMVINVQNSEVISVTLDDSLIYATRNWVDTNYIRRNEIIDNLTTDDATKPVSAKQAKLLQDNKLNKTANAASATKLATARKIGGVSFDGSADINLPGVNAVGNQSTTGNAASADKLSTARTISVTGNGMTASGSFDGSGNLTITPTFTTQASTVSNTTVATTAFVQAVNTADTGSSATAVKLKTARKIGGVSFDGTSDINLPLLGVRQTWKDVKSQRAVRTTYQNTTGQPIQLFINANFDNGYITLNDVDYFVADDTAWGWLCLVLPNMTKYAIRGDGDQRILTWLELR